MVTSLTFVQQAGLVSINLLTLRTATRIFRSDRGVNSCALVCTFWLLAGFLEFWPKFLASHLDEEPLFSAYLVSFIARANICARWGADSVPVAHNPAQS
jgi:hypothetical protein